MSIFKESFRDYVKKQIELRQGIISLGNDGGPRFNSHTLQHTVAAGGGTVNIPYGAFYANTLNRTCVIRMSSGADLTHAGVYEILEQWELDQDITAGSDLAKMYILEGGVLNTGNNHSDLNTLDADKNPTMDWLTNAQPKSGWTNSKNKKNSTYGDALTRSNSINKLGDDYGIVPMPGIVDASIKTKSAYGSIREAKVTFKCHNQRQLEILELLYMRPGVPVLLEWGWTTYVNNEGKLITDSSLPSTPEFWESGGDGNMPSIYRKIISNKQKTGGNYDGLMGMVKNFSYKARKDGGYDCSTELTAMGEIIESLKGRQATPSFTNKILAPFTVNTGLPNEKDNEDPEVAALGHLYDEFKPDEGDLDGLQLILIDLEAYLLMNDEVMGYTKAAKGLSYTQQSQKTITSINNLWAGGLANDVEFIKDWGDCLNRAIKYFDLDYSSWTSEKALYQSNMLTNFIAHHGNRGQTAAYTTPDIVRDLSHNEVDAEGNSWTGAGWKTGYIKWEALAYLINKYSITPLANDKSSGEEYDEQSENEPIVKLATHYIENEDKNPGGADGWNTSGARLRPYQFAEIPMRDWDFEIIPGQNRGWGKMTGLGSYTQVFDSPNRMLDRSTDHKVCMLPNKFTDFGGLYTSDQDLNYPPFHLISLSAHTDSKRSKVKEFIEKSPVKEKEQLRSIGNVLFNLEHLIRKYQSMAYEKEKDTFIRKDDFSIYTFIEEIWSDVNRATGGAHKFIPQVDHERPDIIRIIDMQTSESDLPDPTKIHVMNIQGNSTIVRDFTYNSLIPSALSATIGIAMQNPDSVDDLDGATFAAMAKNIKSRFIQHKPKPAVKPSVLAKQVKKWKESYDKKMENIDKMGSTLSDIVSFQRIGYGQSTVGDTEVAVGRGFTEPFDVSSGPTKQKSLYKAVLKVMGLHSKNGTYPSTHPNSGQKYYKGQPKPEPQVNNASAVIPLKFNCKMDGIGGILIGNVFRIDPTRLPRGYKGTDVAFVTTGESQKITAGNDWTTTLNGQLTLLPFATPKSTTTTTGVTSVTPTPVTPTSTTTPTTPSSPAGGMWKLSELKNTVGINGGTGTELTPLKDLLSELEGTDGPYPYGVYNYGAGEPGGNYETMPSSHVKGSKANKDALGKPPINTLTMYELNRRMKLPHRVPASDGCSKNTGGPYNDNLDVNGCHIFAAGKYQIIPKTLNGNHLPSYWNDNDIFDGPMQEKLGDVLILQKRSRLRAYLKGENTGTEQDLINAVNDVGWEWASSPVITYAAQKYATRSGGNMSDVLGSVKTGVGNLGNYGGTGVNKKIKKTYVKNVVINLIHSRWQLAQKEGNPQMPSFQPDFIYFDLNPGDTLSGTKQVGES